MYTGYAIYTLSQIVVSLYLKSEIYLKMIERSLEILKRNTNLERNMYLKIPS